MYTENFGENLLSNRKQNLTDLFQLALKVVSATFLLVCFLSLNESTCQTRKNAFYFTRSRENQILVF